MAQVKKRHPLEIIKCSYPRRTKDGRYIYFIVSYQKQGKELTTYARIPCKPLPWDEADWELEVPGFSRLQTGKYRERIISRVRLHILGIDPERPNN